MTPIEGLSLKIVSITIHYITLLGDFNSPDINWSANIPKFDGVHDRLLDCLSNLGFIQFVNEPTRTQFNGASNILDIILCNDPLAVNIECISEHFVTSDHCAVNFSFSIINANSGLDICAENTSSCLSETADQPIHINLSTYNWSADDYDAINDQLLALTFWV